MNKLKLFLTSSLILIISFTYLVIKHDLLVNSVAFTPTIFIYDNDEYQNQQSMAKGSRVLGFNKEGNKIIDINMGSQNVESSMQIRGGNNVVLFTGKDRSVLFNKRNDDYHTLNTCGNMDLRSANLQADQVLMASKIENNKINLMVNDQCFYDIELSNQANDAKLSYLTLRGNDIYFQINNNELSQLYTYNINSKKTKLISETNNPYHSNLDLNYVQKSDKIYFNDRDHHRLLKIDAYTGQIISEVKIDEGYHLNNASLQNQGYFLVYDEMNRFIVFDNDLKEIGRFKVYENEYIHNYYALDNLLYYTTADDVKVVNYYGEVVAQYDNLIKKPYTHPGIFVTK